MIKFTERQEQARDLLAGNNLHTLLLGGSRSGKTFLLIDRILIRALKAPGSRHAILRFRANAARNSIALDTLPKIASMRAECLDDKGAKWGKRVSLEEHRQEGYFQLPNGSQIWIGGLDDKDRVDKILGMEFVTIMLNEISQIPYSSVTTALTRLAQKVDEICGVTGKRKTLKLKAYYDLNPSGTGHWSYQLFVLGKTADGRSFLTEEQKEQYKWMQINPKDNIANLPNGYIQTLESLPERQRMRFLSGEYCNEIDGALWTLERLEWCRVDEAPVDLARVVVAVDPSGCKGEEDTRSDEIGIVVAAKGRDGHCYLLEDLTMRGSPEQWGRKVIEAYRYYKADAVIGEVNYGGDLVRANIHAIDKTVKYKEVRASRGKVLRAEPVAALYEPTPDGLIRVHHVGKEEKWSALETELLFFSQSEYKGPRSPNRADAAVWCVTELMIDGFESVVAPIVGVVETSTSYWRQA